jgi:hypothetical protein
MIPNPWPSSEHSIQEDQGGPLEMELAAKVKENYVEDQPWTDAGERALLAAALAATLVEYRHHVQQRTDHPRSEGVGPAWRMMARLRQLGE